MIRKLVIIILVLLAVATAVLWVISVRAETTTEFRETPSSYELQTVYVIPTLWEHRWNTNGEGRNRVQHYTSITCFDGEATFSYSAFYYGRKPSPESWSIGAPGLLRIAAAKHVFSAPLPETDLWPTDATWNLNVHPGWLSLLLVTYPIVAFVRGPYRRHRRRKKGLCLKCGYNLKGNVSGVCSECGEKVNS